MMEMAGSCEKKKGEREKERKNNNVFSSENTNWSREKRGKLAKVVLWPNIGDTYSKEEKKLSRVEKKGIVGLLVSKQIVLIQVYYFIFSGQRVIYQ